MPIALASALVAMAATNPVGHPSGASIATRDRHEIRRARQVYDRLVDERLAKAHDAGAALVPFQEAAGGPLVCRGQVDAECAHRSLSVVAVLTSVAYGFWAGR